jgi:phosphoglycolate phosphatase
MAQSSNAYCTPFMDLRLLPDCEDVTIQCPDDPDADALASAYALYRFFHARGKRAAILYAGSKAIDKPALLTMIDRLELPLVHGALPQSWKGLLVVIAGRSSAVSVKNAATTQVCIGNAIPEGPLPNLCDLRPYLSSCSTLVWQLLTKVEFTIDRNLAAALRFGLYSASNGFTEFRFPLDRDMADALDYDNFLFNAFKRSSLHIETLLQSINVLHCLEYQMEGNFLLINVLPCEPETLRFVSDLSLQVQGVDLAVAYMETGQGLRFCIRSGTREVKASHLTDWILENLPYLGGGAQEKGGGFILAQDYKRQHQELSPREFFIERLHSHQRDYDIIDCRDNPRTGVLYAYQKLPVVQGYVRCSRLFPRRTRLHIRMLEGDITVTVDSQTYLMIGLAGEVYPINRATFAKAYTKTEAPFQPALPYTPTVFAHDSVERVALLDHAESCVSKEKRVLARQIEHGIKLFTLWDQDSYVCGKPGDWLVQRRENRHDLYIIKKDIFPELYEPVEKFQNVVNEKNN